MTKEKVTKLKHGIYRVFWKSGGSSVASVGSTGSGKRWLAATNWIAEDDKYPKIAATHMWGQVKSVVFLIAD